MTQQDNDRYITADQAADTLGTSSRTVHRYGEQGQIKTRKTGRRVMFHEGDVQRLANDLRAQRHGPDPDEVAKLRDQLQQAVYRIGYLESQLERRLLPDHEMQLRDELAATKAREDELRRRVTRAEAPWRLWLIIALIVVVAVLVTLFVIGGR